MKVVVVGGGGVWGNSLTVLSMNFTSASLIPFGVGYCAVLPYSFVSLLPYKFTSGWDPGCSPISSVSRWVFNYLGGGSRFFLSN